MSTGKKKAKPIARLLDDPNKEIHKTYGPLGLLSKLWRTMLKDNQISGYRFSMLVERFLNNPKHKVPDNPKERFDNRGNLNKELTNPQMSWKVFIKSLRLQDVLDFKLTIEARHRDGRITRHSVMTVLSEDANDFPEFDEALIAIDANVKLPTLPLDQEHIEFLDLDDDEEQ